MLQQLLCNSMPSGLSAHSYPVEVGNPSHLPVDGCKPIRVAHAILVDEEFHILPNAKANGMILVEHVEENRHEVSESVEFR